MRQAPGMHRIPERSKGIPWRFWHRLRALGRTPRKYAPSATFPSLNASPSSISSLSVEKEGLPYRAPTLFLSPNTQSPILRTQKRGFLSPHLIQPMPPGHKRPPNTDYFDFQLPPSENPLRVSRRISTLAVNSQEVTARLFCYEGGES